MNALCDMPFYDRMNADRVLNWHPDLDRLVPLTIRGDGNCLLNSVCAAMWGIQDRKRTVRTVMLHGLLDDDAWKLRDRWATCEARADLAIGRVACADPSELKEWVTGVHDRLSGEFDMQLRWAEQPSASLCALHVFMLANVLCRPIVVYGPSLAGGQDGGCVPNDMVGVYLPLLWESCPAHAVREPILLAYDAGHFWALVPLDAQQSAKVPLVGADGSPMELKCLLEGEDREVLIQRWMDVGALQVCDQIMEVGFAVTCKYNPHPHLSALVSAFVQQVLG
eukprot:TRINITY_DN19463_c0_g1_i2.p1 TRINITY_DN19463_c0_g1~~TRINITY_DN19463_c0_g1_i2.p1  ORF type:complete len:280 (+),score=52.75 TRINITY_DN19463_c0_g1_i2:447-1286(+)